MKKHTNRLTFASALALMLVAGVSAQQTRVQAPPPAQNVAKPGTAALAGSVMTDEQTPQPVRRVAITIASTEGTVNRTVYTDENGRFSATGLPAGRYTVSANKAPYLRTSFGAKRYDMPGTPVTLKDAQQMSDIVMRMSRGGVISGRITDENGEPAFGVNVRALQLRTQFGERTFVPVAGGGNLGGDSTDDHGAYRIFGLPPGEYVITASPRMTAGEVKAMTETEIRAIMNALQQQQQAAQQAQQNTMVGGSPAPTPTPTPTPTPDPDKMTVAYSPVYYPGTTVAASASTVMLGVGEEKAGVDISLRLVRTTTLEGMVALPEGIQPQNVQLTMVPSSAGMGLAGIEGIALQRASVGPDGKFTYNAVPPGLYTISARATKPTNPPAGMPPPPPPPPVPPPGAVRQATFTAAAGAEGLALGDFFVMGGGGDGLQYWGQIDVPVDGTPISGVSIALQPGMTITGKVEFRSTGVRPGADFKRVTLTLTPAPTSGALRVNLSVPIAEIDETGKFTISGVTPGKYVIRGNAPATQGSGPMPPWRIGSAVVKGRDIMDFPLEVLPNDNITEAVVTFTDAAAEIGGSLQDATGRPAPDYTIVVFAADKAYWTQNSRRVRNTRPGTDGRFSIANLPPGDYRIAAVVDVSPTEIVEPAFLEQIVGASIAVTVGLGEKKTQDLKIAGIPGGL